ncbi:MAG: prepilin peptidase, partial [bacterium]
IFIFGLIIGSFVGLCAYRIPRGKTIVLGFSYCDFCEMPLTWQEKFPLLGFIILKGKSRCCGHRIRLVYPFLELCTAASFLAAYYFAPGIGYFLYSIVFLGFLPVGALIDLEHRLLPNRLTFTGIIAALLFSFFGDVTSMENMLLGLLVCSGYLLTGNAISKHLFQKPQALGGGDIKFAAMIGAFLGLELGILAILSACVVAAFFGSFKLLTNKSFRKRRELPFGPFLALGALIALMVGNRILDWYLSGNMLMAIK